jgi:DNA helicase-2/ATP-dependent DNA helicase PcrA
VEPRNAVQLMTIHSAKGLEFRHVFVLRVASASLPSYHRDPLVEFPRELRNFATANEEDAKTLHAQEQRRLFYVAMTRARDGLFLCGKAGQKNKQPAAPQRYLAQLVEAAQMLDGALEWRILPMPLIETIHAAAEPLPRISQWMQLAPREDARLNQLSASAIDRYERCPLAFKLDRDWHIPEEPGAPLEFGGAMHLALKAYYDGVKAGRPLKEADVIACFLDQLSKARIPEEEQRRRYEQDGREQLSRLLRSPQAEPKGEILENERRFSISIAGTTVTGRMDRLEKLDGNRVRIVDYKTGAPKSDDDAEDSLQLSIYALAARSEKLDPVSLAFVNLRDGTIAEATRTATDLAKAEAKVMEVAKKIGDREFEPRPGSQCRNCCYYSLCPDKELLIPAPPVERALAAEQGLLPFFN